MKFLNQSGLCKLSSGPCCSIQVPDEDEKLVDVCVLKTKKKRSAVECVFPQCADRVELVCSKRYI